QRMQGRAGYESTGKTWIVDDEHDDEPDVLDPTDKEVSIRGVDPVGMADEIVHQAREHCEEKGTRTHYQVVAFAEVEGEMQAVGHPFKIPMTLFEQLTPPTSNKDEVFGQVAGFTTILLGERRELFKM